VVTEDLVLFAPFLVQPHPAAAPLDEIIGHLHCEDGIDAGKRLDHQTDQSAIAQAGQGSGVDGIEQCARLVRI